MSHSTFQYPLSPYVEKNLFRDQVYEKRPFPPFSIAKANLPIPILPEQPEWVAMYWRAWELIWQQIRFPTEQTGLVSFFVDPIQNGHLLMWDTAFMAQFGLYARRACDCMGALNNFYAKQHDDGFICREIDAVSGKDFFSPFDPNGTGPNVLAWAEWHHFRQTGDEQRLADVFWPLLAYHNWCRTHRTWQNGLYWATGLSSSMNNQPRVPDSLHHHRHYAWVDASLQASLSCNLLEKMATLLGKKKITTKLNQERQALIKLINEHMWNEETQFYQDIDANGRFSSVKSIGAYWALLDSQVVPEKRLTPFIQQLRDNWAFNLPHMIPSQSADSVGYNAQSGNSWRGAIWASTNYMVLRGLHHVKQFRLAHKIGVNHLENVAQVFKETNTFWQNYAPETAVSGDPSLPNFISTAGLSAISILLENVIGITVDWPQRRVRWDRRLDTEKSYGVENYPVGADGTLSLIGETEKVTITTDTPLTLVIRDAAQSLQTAVPAGTTEIDLT